MSCEQGCYEASIQACGDIILKPTAGVDATTEYFVIISRPGRSQAYQRLLTSDADKAITILKSDFPPGFFLKGNFYKLTLRKGDDYKVVLPMTFGATAYYCVLIKVTEFDVAEGDTSPIDTIGYEYPAEEEEA